MNSFQNFDLLSIGITIAAIGILGFIIFLSNKKSITNQSFLVFSSITIFWGISNYISYSVVSSEISLGLFRLTIFFGIWHSFSLYLFVRSFPESAIELSKFEKYTIVPIVTITSILTLTPFMLQYIAATNAEGRIQEIQNGAGMALYGLTVLGLVLASIINLIRKYIRAEASKKRPYVFVLTGIAITFALLMSFNFILPAFFDNPKLIPYGGIYFFPLIFLTTYAIAKHHLLNAKLIATETLTFALAATTLLEVILSNSTAQIIFRSGVFLLVLAIGVVLIRSVRREVEQRERLEVLTKELSAANEKLKELDVQKSQFLSFASHDLKSPINIIKQFATLIADGTYKEPAKVAETIQKIKDTADRATHLVDDFLDIRKIEEGHMDYTFEAKDIVPFVKGITEDYAPLAKAQKNIAVSFESVVASANVKMDTTRLRQVVQNLLSNSVKYTEAGWIKVSLVEEQKSILISVKDSGLGMDKQLLPILFEQFRRDPSVAKKIQGTGLGLYISKQIVIAHGGEVWAESEGKGFGSTFFVRLPKAV